jgi:hypothetical protein
MVYTRVCMVNKNYGHGEFELNLVDSRRELLSVVKACLLQL